MLIPDLTFRSNVAPYDVLTSITFYQNADGGTILPVGQGEDSEDYVFRIYNNWALNTAIATAFNVHLTTYDGPTVVSHTATTLPVLQAWTHALQYGYGEGATTPGTFTSYVGIDTPIGGTSQYVFGKGSDGSVGQSQIRAGTTTNGVGFLACTSYVSVPLVTTPLTYVFCLTCIYEYTL